MGNRTGRKQPARSLSRATLFASDKGETAPETRIGELIDPQANGCWLYGTTDRYGHTKVYGEVVLVHRWVYELLVGPIPDGYHLHHECETTACVNPAHLRPLTPAEHAARHKEMRSNS